MQDNSVQPKNRQFLNLIIWEEEEDCTVLPNNVMFSFHMKHDNSLAQLFSDDHVRLMDKWLPKTQEILDLHQFNNEFGKIIEKCPNLLEKCQEVLKRYLLSVRCVERSPIYLGNEGNFYIGIRPESSGEEKEFFTFIGENDEIRWEPLGKQQRREEKTSQMEEEKKETDVNYRQFVKLIRKEEFTIGIKSNHSKLWHGVQFKRQQLGTFLYIAEWQNDRIQSNFKLNFISDSQIEVYYRQLINRRRERRLLRFLEGGQIKEAGLDQQEIRLSRQ